MGGELTAHPVSSSGTCSHVVGKGKEGGVTRVQCHDQSVAQLAICSL